MAKTSKHLKRTDLEIDKNPHIPEGKRAEDGRKDVSVGPQRKHDTPAYNADARSLHMSGGVPHERATDDELGVKTGPGTAPVEGAGTDPNNPNDAPDDESHAAADSRARVGRSSDDK